MRTTAACLLTLALALGACDRSDNGTTGTGTDAGTTGTGTSGTGTGTTGTTNERRPADADNTGRNERDRSTEARTPMNQGNNSADIDITAAIRRAVMDNDALSTNAKNCKIITENGVVTLRGPVDSQAEKDAIEAAARAATGVTRVDNQLEIAAR